jgi:hypothetical protein
MSPGRDACLAARRTYDDEFGSIPEEYDNGLECALGFDQLLSKPPKPIAD